MLTVSKCLPGGRGLAPVLLKRAPTVQLDWDVRQKSRFEVHDGSGRRLGVFLPRGTVVRGGDVLVAEDGSMIRVEAAPQPVLEVRACAVHGSPFDLTRAAYHLGNRHVQLELRPDCLRLEADHVLADMLRAMHLEVTEVRAPFEPEAGAYAGGPPGHGHGHAHGQELGRVHGHEGACAHDLEHRPACGHDHGRSHEQGAGHHTRTLGHAHGPSCGHDHDHPQGAACRHPDHAHALHDPAPVQEPSTGKPAC